MTALGNLDRARIGELHARELGGATGLWQLDPDMVTIGKAIAGGLPMGAYGVTAELR